MPNLNLDPIEVQKFNVMASDWWDPKGRSRPLHELNPTRLQFITDRCQIREKSVIDIGCGGGILSESLAYRGAIVTGIDASSEVLAVARMHAIENQSSHLSRLQYIESTAETYAEQNPATFEVVTCMEMLEHVPDPNSVIEACATLVKTGGDLFFSTLNRTPKSYLLAILGAEYVLKLLPRGTHQYEKFIRPSELEKSLRNNGLVLQDCVGIHYNPFTRSAKINTDVSVNYLVHAKKVG